jgi:EAL domain-containing protein (putative c-di-GMP-specific phosphodiesterase class I)/FixJ family two-component response regulator/GGDEF domain-containing protein
MSKYSPGADNEFHTRSLERLNRLYTMLSSINRTIVRAKTPNDIYGAACHIAVEEGNFRFAIIALVEPQEHKLVTVATAGTQVDLQWLPTCNREGSQGKLCVVNDIRTDERTARFRSILEASGILSVSSFLLYQEQALVGIMTVGVGETNYFGDAELHLLEEVSEDISYAIDILRRDEKRLAGEAKMQYLAYYDAHTGLPGRPLFEERFSTICEQNPNTIISVMAINLCNYHELLQVLGQNAGINIARTVANRIETGMPTAIVSRIAEAVFALVLECGEKLHEIEEIAWEIHRSIAEVIIIDEQEIFLEAFVGIAMFPKDGGPIEVVKAALTATDRASPESRDCCRFFVSGMDSIWRRRLNLDTALRHAITHQEFELFYQPQVDLASGLVVGAEALLRWQRPDSGLVLPGEFIPMLEETGLICTVGEWALNEACSACRRWQDDKLPPVRVAVNLSGRQFRDSNVELLVRQALSNTHLDPQWLELEVTESIILPNAANIIRTLCDINAAGISEALDDFGTGYSSLSYLQRLPVQRLKIDRSFIANITSTPNDAAIVRAVVGMAHSLGISVIAEGVETQGQLNYLHGLSCDEIQGYYFSLPLTEADFVALLRDSRCIHLDDTQPVQERTMLLIDDDSKLLSAMQRMLKRTEIHILTTTSPNEGFDLLATNPVGVVVCDQRMPEMTGTEFLRRVKELFPATVRIVMSGYTDLNSVIDAVNRGAVYKFLTKPLQRETFLAILMDAFHLHEVERDNLVLSRQLQDLLISTKGNRGTNIH